MEKYIFLCDVDGTLLRGSSGIPKKVIKAAHMFMNAGGLLSLCTGRAPVSARWVAKDMGVNMPCILYTGSAIYDFKSESFIWSHSFDSEILTVIEQLYNEHPDVSLQVYTCEKIYILRTNKSLKERGIKEESNGPLSRLSDIKGNILKIVLSCDCSEKLYHCRDSLFLSNKYIFAFSSTHFAEVVPQGAGKDAAMKIMSQLFNVRLSNFFVAGNGMTDLPMMELGGYSFAPANSARPLLDICNMVVPPVEEGGMEKAFYTAYELMQGSQIKHSLTSL